MGVAAEDTVNVAGAGIGNGATLYFVREAQPARAEAIEPARDGLVLGVELLHRAVKALEEPAEKYIAGDEAVELVAVDGEVTHAVVLPHVALVDGDANEVGHDV